MTLVHHTNWNASMCALSAFCFSLAKFTHNILVFLTSSGEFSLPIRIFYYPYFCIARHPLCTSASNQFCNYQFVSINYVTASMLAFRTDLFRSGVQYYELQIQHSHLYISVHNEFIHSTYLFSIMYK